MASRLPVSDDEEQSDIRYAPTTQFDIVGLAGGVGAVYPHLGYTACQNAIYSSITLK